MSDLQQFKAKICITAAALTFHKGKVLLVKHKKLGLWLAPGGHVEPNELPHRAAERETLEETGVKVTVFDPYYVQDSTQSEYLPSPIESNLHWVSMYNYDKRTENPKKYTPEPKWAKGCEQHLGLLYLAKPRGSVEVTHNDQETDAVGWFTQEEILRLDVLADQQAEFRHAFEVISGKHSV